MIARALWIAAESLVVLLLGALAILSLPFVALIWIAAGVAWIWARAFGTAADPGDPPPVPAPPEGLWRPLETPGQAPHKLVGHDNPAGSIDAIFEGGGVKAIAQIGAVAATEAAGLRWRLLGGTSGGAIVAALLARGKSSAEIWTILTHDDLSRILKVWYLPQERAVRRKKYFFVPLLPGLVKWKAAVPGDVFRDVMSESLQLNRRELTFGDLRCDPSDTIHDYRLKVVATDVSRGRPIVLPDDLPQYWEPWERAREEIEVSGGSMSDLTPQRVRDAFPVADAVRMSMSIPFVFKPYGLHLNGDGGPDDAKDQQQRGRAVEIVDGGVSSNFPIWIFDRTDGQPPTRPTFGFLLDETRTPAGERASAVPRIWTVLALFRHVVTSGMGAMDKRLSDHNDSRTARLQTLGVSTTDFGLPIERQRQLYQQGYADAIAFFQKFDWDTYRTKYRGVVLEPPASVATTPDPASPG